MSNCSGKVYLVGAGPGNADYLTIKAEYILSQAEILVYDALVAPELLELVPSDCLQLAVGKRGGKLSTPQSSINQLLVAYCLQGKRVVRLKSGDPLIFGRASEEIEALLAQGCEFELIPGISSALAAPLLANIPLTHKDLSRSFLVVSAHQPEILDWQVLAKIDTLVILMGGRSLETIVEKLQQYGRSPDLPVAIIRDCAREQQRIWLGTLANIVQQTAHFSLSPAVIVIGEVVKLGENWQMEIKEQIMKLPLRGKTILVTRAAEQSSQFSQLLQAQGAKVMEMPTLVIVPPSSWQQLDRAIARLEDFDWLILTSANGVEYFFERLATLGKDARALAGSKIAVVGKKTAASLQKKGLQPDFIPPDFVADSLVKNFPETLNQKKVLFPRVETGGRAILVKELSAQGAEVVEVPAYQSRCPAHISPLAWSALKNQTVDMITFASSKTIANFQALLESEVNSEETISSLLTRVKIASIGPQTSKTCQELLGKVPLEAKEYTLEGLTQTIVEYYTQSEN